MISSEDLAELLPNYEAFANATDPTAPAFSRGRLLFNSKCKQLYEAENESTRSKFTLEQFKAQILIPDLLQFSKQRQSRFPTVQPELKRPGK